MPASIPRTRRWRRWLLAAALSGLGALAFSEAALRWLLFSDSAPAARLGTALRSPGRFADRHDPAYWKLRYRLESWDRKGTTADYDPELGWVAPLVDADSHAHVDLALLAGRRPVVLHGDSFAHCLTGEGDCWQGLLDRSELGGAAVLLNHGAAGYGLDQIYLSYARSIEVYAALDPVVVIGVLVDDDLDRSTLDFRRSPKPRLRVDEQGRLVLPEEPVPADARGWIEAEGTGIRSYVAALVGGWWQGLRAQDEDAEDSAHAREVQRLTRAILERLAADLRSRGLSAFVWVFSARAQSAPSGRQDWRERFLLAELERLGLSYRLSRDALASELAAGAPLDDFFLPDGHFNARGNAAVFPQLLDEVRRALEGHPAERRPGAAAPSAADPAGSRLRLPGAVVERLSEAGAGARIQAVNGPMPQLDALGAQRRVVLLAGDDGTAQLTWRLLRPAAHFSARISRFERADGREVAQASSLRLLLDGREVRRVELTAAAAPVDVELDLDGAELLGLELQGAPGEAACVGAPLLQPRDGRQ